MKQKPYKLFLYTGLLLVLASLFCLKQNNEIDIHIHDTYLVVSQIHVLWFLTFLAFIIWALYVLTNGILFSKMLTWMHLIFTIFPLLITASTIFLVASYINIKPLEYFDYSNWNSFDNYTTFSKTIGITFFALILGQFIFILNFILGLIKKFATTKT